MCECVRVCVCVHMCALFGDRVMAPSLYQRNDFLDPGQRPPTSVSFILHHAVPDGTFGNAK